jgi:homoserine O-acetyltransferase
MTDLKSQISFFSSIRSHSIKSLLACIAVITLYAPLQARAYEDTVTKEVFEMPLFNTVGGQVIRSVRIGYESYGRLNAKADNAILICHFLTGTSHAAGKYQASDPQAGYWDSIIGNGKPIDTNKYFVLSSDTLVNLGVGDPHVVTTGPSSINPLTGRNYGLSFPIVTIQDFVRVQKALADKLGIKKFVLVMGASMGAMQAIEWATDYPEMVERIIPVTSSGFESNAYLIQTLHNWSYPIMMDPAWNHGDFYGKHPPTRGLSQALTEVTLSSRSPTWAQKLFANRIASEGQHPIQQWQNKYAIEETFAQAAEARSKISDANHFLYLVRAQQLFKAGNYADIQQAIERVQAKALFISAPSDLLFFPSYATSTVRALKEADKSARQIELVGSGGNLDGITEIESVADEIRNFIEH